MKEENVGSVIVEDDDQPVGVVTDRDLTIEVLERRLDPREVTAEQIMTHDPATIRADDGVFELTNRLFETEVRRMPVVDDEGVSSASSRSTICSSSSRRNRTISRVASRQNRPPTDRTFAVVPPRNGRRVSTVIAHDSADAGRCSTACPTPAGLARRSRFPFAGSLVPR